MKDLHSLRKSVTIMIRLCLAIATAFALATMFAPGPIMRIYTNEEPIIREGIRYFNWSIASYWLMGLSQTVTIVLRSVGIVQMPLLTSIAAFFVNIGANYVFIFGKFGAPEMGVAGAALGTLISRIVEFTIIVGYFFLRDQRIHYRIRNLFDRCGDMVGEYLRISIPVLISDTLLGLGTAIGVIAGGIIMAISPFVISCYNITEATAAIAEQLMLAVGFIVIFQSMNSILTKGVMRGGGDTRFLMIADILFLWIVSIPLGALAGLVWGLPAFWIYTFLKIDQIIKAFWCIFRLRSRKWIKVIRSASET